MSRIFHTLHFGNWYIAVSKKVSLQALKDEERSVVKYMSYSFKRNLRKNA